MDRRCLYSCRASDFLQPPQKLTVDATPHQTFFLNTLTVEFDTYGSEKFDSLTVESFSTVEQTVEFWISGFRWREATHILWATLLRINPSLSAWKSCKSLLMGSWFLKKFRLRRAHNIPKVTDSQIVTTVSGKIIRKPSTDIALVPHKEVDVSCYELPSWYVEQHRH